MRFEESGTLIHRGETFYLRRDLGGLYQLEASSSPVELLGMRVLLSGTCVGTDLIHVDRLTGTDD
jgi:hypothetical protein